MLLKLSEKWVLNATSLPNIFRYEYDPEFSKHVSKELAETQGQNLLLVNPRRACAARVTVLGLRVSWGAIFSVKGGKGGKKGVEGQSEMKCHEKRKR